MTKKPSAKLFVHTADCYHVTNTKDNSGGKVETFSSAYANDARCFVQPAVSKVMELYAKRNEEVTHSIFIQSQTVYDAIKKDDLIVFNLRNYRVMGRRNSDELNRVFRADVKEFFGDITFGS